MALCSPGESACFHIFLFFINTVYSFLQLTCLQGIKEGKIVETRYRSMLCAFTEILHSRMTAWKTAVPLGRKINLLEWAQIRKRKRAKKLQDYGLDSIVQYSALQVF